MRPRRRSSAPTPLAFLGLRGLGKTVLLNEVRARTPEGVHLRLEIEKHASLARSIHHAVAIDSVLRHISLPSFELPHDMGSVALTAPAEQADPETLPIGRAISELAASVAAVKRYLVITIDEIQNADIGAFRSLVSIVHQSAGTANPILLASAGLPESAIVLDALHTYAKRWDRFELDFLTRAETVEAIRSPLQQSGVAIADDALDLLVAEAAGYPYFVQKYASTIFNHLSGRSITREALGPGPHPLRTVSDALGVKSAAISSIRGNLIKRGIVFVPSAGTIQFRMPLADRYVRDHASFFFDPAAETYLAKLAN